MATRFVIVDRDSPLLLPPDLRDWVPSDHLAHFIIDAVEALDLREVRVNTRGTGDAQYPPTMLLALLVSSTATSTFGSRRIEQTAAEAASGTTVYAALDKTSHHRSVADLEKKPEPSAPSTGASVTEVMRYRLQSSTCKQRYKLRQQTVEPVFGIIKSVLGFRPFLLRGIAKVSTEWTLVCLAYNLKRLHRLRAGRKPAVAGYRPRGHPSPKEKYPENPFPLPCLARQLAARQSWPPRYRRMLANHSSRRFSSPTGCWTHPN